MKKPLPRAPGLNRRNFVIKGLVGVSGLAASAAVTSAATDAPWATVSRISLKKQDVILFQGDSITDAGRSRSKADVPNEQAGLGNGYAWLAAAGLLATRPTEEFKIYNRGISGHKVFQLAERWQADCLDLKPNVLSILIGVNDIWHKLNGSYDGTLQVYERDYRALLSRTKAALPKIRFVICEPFVLRCGAVNDKWFPEFDQYRAAARRVADSFRATFVPFQAMFDEAVKYASPEHWAKDGVHPTPSGAALMAHEWLRALEGR